MGGDARQLPPDARPTGQQDAPARPRPRACRPSLYLMTNHRCGDRQEEPLQPLTPPLPGLCAEAPSPVPTLGAPRVTKAQRLREGWLPPCTGRDPGLQALEAAGGSHHAVGQGVPALSWSLNDSGDHQPGCGRL